MGAIFKTSTVSDDDDWQDPLETASVLGVLGAYQEELAREISAIQTEDESAWDDDVEMPYFEETEPWHVYLGDAWRALRSADAAVEQNDIRRAILFSVSLGISLERLRLVRALEPTVAAQRRSRARLMQNNRKRTATHQKQTQAVVSEFHRRLTKYPNAKRTAIYAQMAKEISDSGEPRWGTKSAETLKKWVNGSCKK